MTCAVVFSKSCGSHIAPACSPDTTESITSTRSAPTITSNCVMPGLPVMETGRSTNSDSPVSVTLPTASSGEAAQTHPTRQNDSTTATKIMRNSRFILHPTPFRKRFLSKYVISNYNFSKKYRQLFALLFWKKILKCLRKRAVRRKIF